MKTERHEFLRANAPNAYAELQDIRAKFDSLPDRRTKGVKAK